MLDYSLKIIVPPAVEPISVAEAREQARIDASDEDRLLEGYIRAAREAAEAYQSRAFIHTVYRMSMDRFPAIIRLPRAPLAVAPLADPPIAPVVTYVDSDGATQTLPADQYRIDEDGEPARVTPVAGWPGIRSVTAAVHITFTAGYGADPSDVPQAVRQAIAIGVAHLYAHRGDAQATGDYPPAFYSLLTPHRMFI